MKNILIICGPTASGKTTLALSIAKLLISQPSLRAERGNPGISIFPSVNILSADSRQIYHGLDIVTGKDIPSDLPKNIKVFGLDMVEPDKVFNLSDYVSYASKIIELSQRENIPLIIVGGTGLYLKSITSNLLNIRVPSNPTLRATLEKLDISSLQKKLKSLNPEKYFSLNNSDVHNPRRLIRAIEISSSHIPEESPHQVLPQGDSSSELQKLSFHWVGLRPDKDSLAKKIRQRVIDRLDQGAITEVETLLKKYPGKNTSLFSSLGVKEIIRFLNSEITSAELVDLWTKAEIDYARRQMVWFKKQPEIVWYDKGIDSKLLLDNFVKYYTT